ncbi:MAG: hypothetical protein M1837_000393 [Sclerophora amabilis]|nr:MAG: hypothetical protein M1837_000393 [Sclerophora amabilis]
MAPRVGSKMRKYSADEDLFLIILYSCTQLTWKDMTACFNEEFESDINFVTLRKHWSNMAGCNPIFLQYRDQQSVLPEYETKFKQVLIKYAVGTKVALPTFAPIKADLPSSSSTAAGAYSSSADAKFHPLTDDQVRWLVIMRCWCYAGKKNWTDTTDLFNHEFGTSLKVAALQRAFKLSRMTDPLYRHLQDVQGMVTDEFVNEAKQFAENHGWVPKLTFTMGDEAGVKLEYVKEDDSGQGSPTGTEESAPTSPTILM